MCMCIYVPCERESSTSGTYILLVHGTPSPAHCLSHPIPLPHDSMSIPESVPNIRSHLRSSSPSERRIHEAQNTTLRLRFPACYDTRVPRPPRCSNRSAPLEPLICCLTSHLSPLKFSHCCRQRLTPIPLAAIHTTLLMIHTTFLTMSCTAHHVEGSVKAARSASAAAILVQRRLCGTQRFISLCEPNEICTAQVYLGRRSCGCGACILEDSGGRRGPRRRARR